MDAELATAARDAGVLPAGGKFAKISLDGVRALRAATGRDFALWDGRCRHIAASLAVGAAGIIATPLSHLPDPFPPAELSHLQAALDGYQAALDALATRAERTLMLQRAAFGDQPGGLTRLFHGDNVIDGLPIEQLQKLLARAGVDMADLVEADAHAAAAGAA